MSTLFKDLEKCAKEWRRAERQKQPTTVNPGKFKGYQDYMLFKYEELCRKFNDFNINK